ncbi:MAG: MiaB/RimO family radical SAM methylthiotransferase [Desulfovibrio sp.]|nr:MiaB/RimO family radical SAM methylthiotransferase [Desulfovibrio sp.]
MRFYLATLGCKVNQYESQALREAWLAQDWQEARTPEQADLIVLNSCAVTAGAIADLRNRARRLHRAAPEGAVIITGCAAEISAEELANLPGVSAVIGQSRKTELLQVGWERRILSPADSPAREPGGVRGVSEWEDTAGPFPDFAVSGSERSRALLKIQDGCSHHCTYCVVPLTRGNARSRNFAEALSEAKRLLASGFREIVLSGVNLRQYGEDLTEQACRKPAASSGCDFWDLLYRLDRELRPAWAGRARLRVSSLDPGQLGQKAMDVLGSSRMVAPHLHLSLQSGSSSVLGRMGRGHYRPEKIPEFFAGLRSCWPTFGLGADILTGFPGESEAEFQESLSLCRALPLTYGHVFPYSRRPGTLAAAMGGQLSEAVKKERSAALRSLIREKKRDFLRMLLDIPLMRVVFEDRSERSGGEGFAEKPRALFFHGLNEFYADCRLETTSAGQVVPKFRVLSRARPLRVEDDALLVALAENADTGQGSK